MSASTPPVPAGATAPVAFPAAAVPPAQPPARARHDRAADALISSYLRELLDAGADAATQPGAAARGRSAATWSR